jgi:hypothetical protein
MTGTWWKMTTKTCFWHKQWASVRDWPDFRRNESRVSISVKSLTQNGLKQPPNGQMPVWTLEMTGTWWKMTTKTFFWHKQWASVPDWPDFRRNESSVSISVKSLTQNGLKQLPNGQMPVWTLEMTGTWWKMTTKTFFWHKQCASDSDWPDFQRNYSVVIHFRQKPHPKRPESSCGKCNKPLRIRTCSSSNPQYGCGGSQNSHLYSRGSGGDSHTTQEHQNPKGGRVITS